MSLFKLNDLFKGDKREISYDKNNFETNSNDIILSTLYHLITNSSI